MGRHPLRFMTANCALALALALSLLNTGTVDARRHQSTQRKTSSSSNNGHVTQPTYNTPHTSGSNSHADVAKLSYPNYNSQPNRPATGNTNTNGNAPPVGWNVPNSQNGPPPAYSANNPIGGAKTNIHEAPPAYNAPNYGAPNYGASNVHTPITASNAHGTQYGALPAGATYHSPGALPQGATYYGGGHMPPGPSYYPGGGALPAGATYLPAGNALPPGATYYSSPPQQSSSGLGFGTGLLAGGLGGALLGHALTPTQTRVVEQAPAAAAGGQDRVIIINNGVPVNSTDGTTIINAGAPASPEASTATPLAPLVPPVSVADGNTAAADTNATAPMGGDQSQPPAGGIICVPVRVNETDPANPSQMIEIEKIACYPAPPPPPPQTAADPNNQQQQQQPALAGAGAQPAANPAMLPPDQSALHVNSGAMSSNLHVSAIIIALFGSMMLYN